MIMLIVKNIVIMMKTKMEYVMSLIYIIQMNRLPNFNSDATFDNGSCIFDLNCSIDEIQIDILLSTDNYPWESSFILNDNQGVVWASEN